MNLLLRIFFFGLGLMLALDALLPTHTETATVSAHDITSVNKGRSEYYKLYFEDARPSNCTVSQKNYHTLQDGAQLTISTTQFLKRCIKIEHHDETLYTNSSWRLFGLALGAAFIAYGIGWFRPEKWWPARE